MEIVINKNYRCERCGKEKRKNIFHKRTPFLVITRDGIEADKERLIVLCPKCYKKFKKEFMKGEQK